MQITQHVPLANTTAPLDASTQSLLTKNSTHLDVALRRLFLPLAAPLRLLHRKTVQPK
jgi:hypothetical protein